MIRALATVAFSSTAALAQVQTPFDAPVLMADVDSKFVKTLDLENDGWMDAVSAFHLGTPTPPSDPYRIVGYYNDHTGRLVRSWSFSVPSTSTFTGTFDQHDAWDVGDLNGDGQQDFAFANRTTFFAYLSNGRLAPTAAITFPLAQPADRSIALADFDLDGDLDVAMTHASSIEIFDLDLANGVLVSRSFVNVPVTNLGRLVAGELTGDTTPDLYAFSKFVVPVQNSVLGTPIAFPDIPTQTFSWDLRNDLGDIDGDGDLDAITFFKREAPGNPHGYRVLRRISPSQWMAEPTLYSGGPARRLYDVDNDGDLDAVCCGGGGGQSLNAGISTLRIALNDGTGSFAESINIPNIGSTAIAGVVDMDHDGRVDFVAGRSIYYQRRPLAGELVPTIGAGNQSTRTLTDLEGDGDVDFEPLPWSVSRNRGDGISLIEPIDVPAAPAGYTNSGQGHHGDWDGDGDEDNLVLVVNQGQFAGLHLLRNRGNGVFVSGGIVANGTALSLFPFLLEDGMAADVDQDGDLDLVLRSYTSTIAGQLRSGWWRNDGATGFVHQAVVAGLIVWKVTDFDGDGITDWVGTSTYGSSGTDSTLAWARGLGNGVLASPVNLAGTAKWYAVDIGDLDSDGDVDVVGVPREGASPFRYPRVLWNQGNGAFATEDFTLELAASTVYEHTNVLDVNGDGRLDFVIGPLYRTHNVLGVYLRKSDNSGFDSPICQVISGIPLTSTVARGVTADVDGDGDTDLVSYNRCFDNLRFDGESAGLRLQGDNGIVGLGGIRPVLGAKGPFRVGQPVRLILRGARPAARVQLVSITSSATPAPTEWDSLITRPPYDPRILKLATTGTWGGEPGSGSCEIAFVVPPSLAGVTRHYTMIVEDAAVHGRRAISNQLTITYAP